MDGIVAILAALGDVHIARLRAAARVLRRIDSELAAWVEHALDWETARRAGITTGLLSPDVLMSEAAARSSAQALRTLKGDLVDPVQVRLFVTAVRERLEKRFEVNPVSPWDG